MPCDVLHGVLAVLHFDAFPKHVLVEIDYLMAWCGKAVPPNCSFEGVVLD